MTTLDLLTDETVWPLLAAAVFVGVVLGNEVCIYLSMQRRRRRARWMDR